MAPAHSRYNRKDFEREWVVYVKPPFGGPQHVLQYLARYTHRVAISNGRLLRLENGRVYFRWRDSQNQNQIKEMALDAVEFIRRFLLHVLPTGFVRDPALWIPLESQSKDHDPALPRTPAAHPQQRRSSWSLAYLSVLSAESAIST